MTGTILVDTNVFVYAYDRSEPVKQQQALAVLDQLIMASAGVITTQVLAESFATVTRRLRAPLSPIEAYQRLENMIRVWTVVEMTGSIVLEAARGVCDYQMAFYDAQIWAAARLTGTDVVLTEDFNSGAVIEGVRFVNPFTPEFELADWL
ncbi:MAG: PIN domain-containing protein [Anaerolineae bacterium]